MSEITISLNYEQIREIIIKELKEDYYLAYKDNPIHKEDSKYRTKVLKALKAVIKHYTTQQEQEEWKNEIAGWMVK